MWGHVSKQGSADCICFCIRTPTYVCRLAALARADTNSFTLPTQTHNLVNHLMSSLQATSCWAQTIWLSILHWPARQWFGRPHNTSSPAQLTHARSRLARFPPDAHGSSAVAWELQPPPAAWHTAARSEAATQRAGAEELDVFRWPGRWSCVFVFHSAAGKGRLLLAPGLSAPPCTPVVKFWQIPSSAGTAACTHCGPRTAARPKKLSHCINQTCSQSQHFE